MSDDDGSIFVTVAIPTWPAIACPICHAIAVNLDGEFVVCEDPKCEAGRAFLQMVEAQKAEATRRLRNVGIHVAGCAYCQRASDRRGLCRTGAALWGRWVAWLIPGPNEEKTPGPTIVRELTEREKEDLSALLCVIHAHMDDCAACQAAADVASMCDVGRENDRRWQAWLGDHQ
jgi:hypothetical protein